MNKPEEYRQLEDTTQETEREIKELKGSKVTGEDPVPCREDPVGVPR